jgi:DNA invertase Pin-like site-specific DNA recombinase
MIWRLDRLGRSLKHLVEVVNELMARKVGLKSLHDPVDTTTPQGRLIFNLFASLAEFERDLIRERTQAGLSAAGPVAATAAGPKAYHAAPSRRLAQRKRSTGKASSAANRSPRNSGSRKRLYIPICATAACRLVSIVWTGVQAAQTKPKG